MPRYHAWINFPTDKAEDQFLKKAKDLMVATHDSDGALYVITHERSDLELAEKLGGEIVHKEVGEICGE